MSDSFYKIHKDFFFRVLYSFFWVIPRRLYFRCRRFGRFCLFHLRKTVQGGRITGMRFIKRTNLIHNLSTVTNILDAGLLAISQNSEGPATGHLDTGFSLFPCVYKQMLRWFPRFQVATTCFSCSPPDLNFLDPYFIFMYMHNNHCHRVTAHLQLNILLVYYDMRGLGSSVGITTTGWTVRDRIPLATRFSSHPDGPWSPPSLL